MQSKTIIILAILAFANVSFAQSDIVFNSGFERLIKLNDTGINWGGTSNGNNLTCKSNIDAPQDCDQGRDATHDDDSDGHAGFSFTKLDANGVPLVDQSVDYETTPWACVRDNVTELVWEIKTDDGGIHDRDNSYKWGGLTALGRDHPDRQGDYYDDWNDLVNGSNAGNGLCGFTDWRVPTITELTSIVNYGSPANTSIYDLDFFPNTNWNLFWYWSSTPMSDIANGAIAINNISAIDNATIRTADAGVRLVRSGQ